MPVVKCPDEITCNLDVSTVLGYDFPFANFSAEKKDGETFIGSFFGLADPPPITPFPTDPNCVVFSTSQTSQKYANTCALTTQSRCADGTLFSESTTFSPCDNTVGNSNAGPPGGKPQSPAGPGASGCVVKKPGDCTKPGGQTFDPAGGGSGTVPYRCLDQESSFDISVESEFAPLLFEVTGGSLPPGMSLQATGDNTAAVTGTPNTPGQYTFTISAGVPPYADSATYALDIFGITNIDLAPDATVGQLYSFQLLGEGGTPPYVFLYDPALFPDWLAMTPSGELIGTPTAADADTDHEFSVTITDSIGRTCEYGGSIFVRCGTIDCSPKSGAGAKNQPLSVQLTGVGGVSPYTFGWTGGGTLPPGVGVSSSGLISGTPTSSGTFQFGVNITDHAGCTGQATITLDIATLGNAATTYSCPTDPTKTYTVAAATYTNTGPYAGFSQDALDALAQNFALNQVNPSCPGLCGLNWSGTQYSYAGQFANTGCLVVIFCVGPGMNAFSPHNINGSVNLGGIITVEKGIFPYPGTYKWYSGANGTGTLYITTVFP